ncbi:MAG: hypothetical protein ACR2OV_14965, partial [Hyphomicrobiaceae bacterium]
MTEAEILVIRGGTTGLIISIVSVSFGMISAYIVGLWLFIRKVPLFLRLVAFALLTSALAFMGGITWGLHELLLGTDRAWAKLDNITSGIPNFGGNRLEQLLDLSLYEVFAGLGFVAFVAIYFALAYMTFVYRWP